MDFYFSRNSNNVFCFTISVVFVVNVSSTIYTFCFLWEYRY